jgi:hypothetical protein
MMRKQTAEAPRASRVLGCLPGPSLADGASSCDMLLPCRSNLLGRDDPFTQAFTGVWEVVTRLGLRLTDDAPITLGRLEIATAEWSATDPGG